MKWSRVGAFVVTGLFLVVPVWGQTETPEPTRDTNLGPYQAQVQVESSQATPAADKLSMALTYYYHDLGGAFGSWKGWRLRGTRTHGLHTALLADLAVETQRAGHGGLFSVSFYHALSPRLHAFANAGFGAGEKFFVRSKQYLELAYVVPVFARITNVANVALVGGLGRNDYGTVSDSQSSMGAVLYANRFVVEYRWIHFDTIQDQVGSNTHIANVLCQNVGPFDLAVQALNGRNGYVSSRVDGLTTYTETRTLGLESTFWLQRGVRGVKARLEYGQKDKDYHRLGLELSSILAF